MAILGELELRIMENLWEQGNPVSVRSVHEGLLNERTLAYTTVMTVLDRLAKKGVVSRERDGRAWLYQAAQTRSDLVVGQIVDAYAEAGDSRSEVLERLVAMMDDGQRAAVRAALDGR
ncbi:BlaI/MecI/CopY family transcriptional regulator [Luteococcus sp. Sow4_B9]|uniref:BlaI/MecI/CopY family transcriptional regulator n=1 Tax=Luteococcus sp. Sow4_B9 TaxID=3438792 RepID=UPI003F990A63